MVNEATIKSFLTLARVGSFTEAARQLFLSQQAVSKHIAKLETDLNCTLFLRERGNLTLTEEGRIYFNAFSQMEEIFQDARKAAGGKGGDPAMTLTIGLTELLDLQPLIRGLIRSYLEQEPEVRIVYKSAPHWKVLDWLEKGSVDVAISFEEEVAQRDGMSYVTMDVMREMLVVSAEHPMATPEATYLDFRDEAMFYSQDPGTGGKDIRQELRQMGFETTGIVETENVLSALASVEQMQGVTLLLESCKLLQSDGLRVYPTNQSSTVVLAYRKNNRKGCLRRFTELASRQFGPGR